MASSRYVNCRMLVVYDYPEGDKVTYSTECEVTFGEKDIAVSFFENGQPKKWVGFDDYDGHYKVHDSDIPNHQGTLHLTPDSGMLQGRWHERVSGFWEIKLGESTQIEE
jgi:hypothetical protein